MGELWIGEQRFHNSQALEDAERKNNSKSDGPTWNGQQTKLESMSLRALAAIMLIFHGKQLMYGLTWAQFSTI